MAQFYWFQYLYDDLSNITSSPFHDQIFSCKDLVLCPSSATHIKDNLSASHSSVWFMKLNTILLTVESLIPEQSQQIGAIQYSFTEWISGLKDISKYLLNKSMLSVSTECQSNPVFQSLQPTHLNVIGRNLWISLWWKHMYHIEVGRSEHPYHTAFSVRVKTNISESITWINIWPDNRSGVPGIAISGGFLSLVF